MMSDENNDNRIGNISKNNEIQNNENASFR